MNESGLDIQALIEAAVAAAHEAGVRGMDEKIQAAMPARPLAHDFVAVQHLVHMGQIGAETGAAAAVKAAERERKKIRQQQYDWKYHNTKLLLRNYRRLNAYYENAVFSTEGAEEADEDFGDIMRSMGRVADEEIIVECKCPVCAFACVTGFQCRLPQKTGPSNPPHIRLCPCIP